MVTRTDQRLALACAVFVVALFAGATVIAADESTRVPPAGLVDRAAYGAGWAYAVDYQTGPAPRPPRDDFTRAACRWRIDGGVNPPAPRWDRNAFLTGCDDAVAATDLERPSR